MSLMIEHDRKPPLLLRIPATHFAVPLGCASQSLVWKLRGGEVGKYINYILWVFSFFVYCAMLLAYALKAYFYPKGILKELHHPVQSNFLFIPFFACGILLLALPQNFRDGLSTPALEVIALIVAILQSILSLHVYSLWLFSKHLSLHESNPTFQIATVGWFVMATTLCSYDSGHGTAEFAKLMFGVGMVFWPVVLFTLLQQMSHQSKTLSPKIWPHATALQPTLYLFMAPPASATTAWVAISGSFDLFSSIIFYFALFWALLMFYNIRILVFRTPFSMALWACTFPSAALYGACRLWNQSLDTPFSETLDWLVLAHAAIIFCFVFAYTVRLLMKGKLFEKDETLIEFVDMSSHAQYMNSSLGPPIQGASRSDV